MTHFPDYRQGIIPYKPKVNGGVAQSIRKQAIKRRQSERVAFFDIKEENLTISVEYSAFRRQT